MGSVELFEGWAVPFGWSQSPQGLNKSGARRIGVKPSMVMVYRSVSQSVSLQRLKGSLAVFAWSLLGGGD